jgi:hypothetical protein
MQSSSTMKPDRSESSESSESSDASDSVSCDPSVIPDVSESSDASESSGSYDGSRSLSSSAHSTSPFPLSRVSPLMGLVARTGRELISVSLYCMVVSSHILKKIRFARARISRALRRDTDPGHARYCARAHSVHGSTRLHNTPSTRPTRSKRATRFDSFSFTTGV